MASTDIRAGSIQKNYTMQDYLTLATMPAAKGMTSLSPLILLRGLGKLNLLSFFPTGPVIFRKSTKKENLLPEIPDSLASSGDREYCSPDRRKNIPWRSGWRAETRKQAFRCY